MALDNATISSQFLAWARAYRLGVAGAGVGGSELVGCFPEPVAESPILIQKPAYTRYRRNADVVDVGHLRPVGSIALASGYLGARCDAQH